MYATPHRIASGIVTAASQASYAYPTWTRGWPNPGLLRREHLHREEPFGVCPEMADAPARTGGEVAEAVRRVLVAVLGMDRLADLEREAGARQPPILARAA